MDDSRSTRREFLGSTIAVITAAAALRAQGRPTIRTIVGKGAPGFAEGVDGEINDPFGVVIGPDGAMYICDVGNSRIRRFDMKARLLSTVAGNGTKGYSGDGGPAIQAAIS